MKKIMIIGAGDFQLPLVKKASEKYFVILVAPVIANVFKEYIDESLLVDVRDKETILAFAKEKRIDGVITDQTDISVRTVAYVAEQMGLPGIGYGTGCLFTDKSLMRKKLIEIGVKQLPNKTVFSKEEALEYYDEIGGNVIIKPLDTQGSRGVQACCDKDDLIAKYDATSKWSSNNAVIVERLATGREFVVEGLAYNYEFKNLICGDTFYFDIPDAYAAKNRIFPSDADVDLYKKVCDLNTKIITGFGLKQGISHSEFIMDGEDVYLIETAARGGGVFISSDLINLSTGLCTEEFLIDIALGQIDSIPKIQPQQCACGYMAFYVPMGEIISVDGKDEIINLPYVHHHQLDNVYVGKLISHGQVDKTSRVAIIVSGKDRSELFERMELIKSILKVDVKTDAGDIQTLIWE